MVGSMNSLVTSWSAVIPAFTGVFWAAKIGVTIVRIRFAPVLPVNTSFHLRAHDRALPHVRDLVTPGGWAVLVDIVSPPGGRARTQLRHRWYGVADAVRTLRRRRAPAYGWTVLRLRQHRAWMEHAATNRPLTREEFHAAYAAAFPGAEFTDSIDPFVCAIRWRKPAG